MKLHKQLLAIIFSILIYNLSNSQVDSLKMNFDLRTRPEFNHGYKTLIPSGGKPETNVYNRARIGFDYFYDKLQIKVSAQDVRTWGQDESLSEKSKLAIFEAWAKYDFNKNISTKIGRQPLSYDNERLFGETDWAMQARSFDALKMIFSFNNGGKLEATATYNNDTNTSSNIYDVLDGGERTKSLQIIHYQIAPNANFNFSVIGANNVVQNTSGTYNSLATVGFNLKKSISDKINLNSSVYYQFGTNTSNQTKNAYEASLNLNIKATPYWNTTLGGEILSGTKYNKDASTNNSFSPLYGTNHKFNGFMDYFYVGNHFNSVGLNDFYLLNKIKLSKSDNINVNAHYFSTNQRISNNDDNYLGTEFDVVYAKSISKQFQLNAGYSQMLASSSMEKLKNVLNPNKYQAWTWIGIKFSPHFKLK